MRPAKKVTRSAIIARLVFLYTASGALFGFTAVLALSRGDFRAMFFWIFIATMIDYTDGSVGRLLKVYDFWPQVDFGKLDSVVDFTTNALIPALAMWLFGSLPSPHLLWAAVILIVSLFRYSRSEQVGSSGLFTGLPVLWVFVMFYAFFLRIPAVVMGALIAVMSVAAFTRIRFIHVARFPTCKLVNSLALLAWWSIYLITVEGIVKGRSLIYLSLAYPVYYVVSSQLLKSTTRVKEESGGRCDAESGSPGG